MKPPKKPQAITDELNAVISKLVELGLADDSNYAVLKPSGSRWDVTFDGSIHIELAMSDQAYAEIYTALANERSYNVKLLDGGLLQLMYSFDKERLLQHRLAYYPSPNLRSFQDDPDTYLDDKLFADIVSRRLIPFPLRFDFDAREGVHQDVIHPQSHLTLGDVEDCRIPVSSPLTPRWFTEFILRNFYHTKEHHFVDKLPAHKEKAAFQATITSNERRLIHICVPTAP